MKPIAKFIKQFTEEKIDFIKINHSYFLVNEKQQEIIGKIEKQPFSAGIFLGKDKNHKFKPSIALLELLSEKSDKKIFVDDKSEWLFLCGRDIFRKAVLVDCLEKGIVLVQNSNDENLGYGLMEDKGNVAVKNILDRGSFLRREK